MVGDGSVVADMTPMKRFVLDQVAIRDAKGLEIGPLNQPVLRKDEACVFYVDHLDTAGLRAKYRDDPAVAVESICAVDYVCAAPTDLPAVLGDERFDYCIASHVIEHVPDVAGWLEAIAAVLAPRARLCLAVPDKRFTFDCYRRLTTPAEVLAAGLLRQSKPGPAQILDHTLHYVPADAQSILAKTIDPDPVDSDNRVRHAWKKASEALATGDYCDVHCWVFTPRSFLAILRVLALCGRLPFTLAAFQGTAAGSNEFFLVLEKAGNDEAVSEEALNRLISTRQGLPPDAPEEELADGKARCEALEEGKALCEGPERRPTARPGLLWRLCRLFASGPRG